MHRIVLTAILLFAAANFLTPAAIASDESVVTSAVPMPVVPEAPEGTECVADPDFMRLNHMKLLQHDRDLTMRDGNRSIDFSLKECVDCHVVRDAEGVAVTVDSPQHFCRSCHEYAAVKIDCFSCHASRPEIEDAIKLGQNPHQASVRDLVPQIDWTSQTGASKAEVGNE